MVVANSNMDSNIIILMGGNDGVLKHDVWPSIDSTGATWDVPTVAGWSARSGHTSVVVSDGSNVLYIRPEMFRDLPNIGPLSEIDIRVTFDTTAVRGLDIYKPTDEKFFHEPALTPAWLEVKVW